jgi:ferredoxin
MPNPSRPEFHAFQVKVPDLDVVFEVTAQQSIVEAAALNGVEILTACENGQCGTCLVKVLDGEPDHRDNALAPEKHQEGWMCACVSRSKSDFLSIEIW